MLVGVLKVVGKDSASLAGLEGIEGSDTPEGIYVKESVEDMEAVIVLKAYQI